MKSRNMTLRVKKSFSLLLVLVLLLSSFASFAETNDNLDANSVITKKESLKEVAWEKITPEVKEELTKDDEYVGVLVYLKDRVDTQRIAEVNGVGKTPYQRKLSSRKALVNALMDKAEDTQYDLIKYLKQEEETGNVEEFKSFYIVNMVYVKATEEVIENIAYMDKVEKIYLNEFIKRDKPIISKDFNLASENENNEDNIEWNIKKVGADKVWDLGYDGTGVVVGIIDTGVDWTHEALMEKWRGYDPSNPENPNPEGNWFDAVYGEEMPYDIYSSPHGTHVMGTILGQDPEGKNKIGVAPGAKWIAAKAFTESGAYDSWLIEAGQWMLAPNGDESKAPDIINNSWGGAAEINDWYRDIVNSWRAAGILPVFAAGNQQMGEPDPWPGSIENPANYPESFAVAATDINNKRGYFSKLGPSLYDEKLIKPEISAPGVNIRSSIPWEYEDGWSGTSMAAPHISGVAALILSANNSFEIDKLEEIIQSTAIPLTDHEYPESPNFGYGYGLVNANNAFEKYIIGDGIVEGKVLIDGKDLEEPEIFHQPLNLAYEGANFLVSATIRDDISIVKAEVWMKGFDDSDWFKIPMELVNGDHKSGSYLGRIYSYLIKEPGFQYKIVVEDYGGNIIEDGEHKVDVSFGVKPGEYKTDFEDYPYGWRVSGEWEWGEITTDEPVAYSGSKVMATNLDGRYSPYSNSLLMSPPIDLRDGTLESPSLRFKHWYETYGEIGDLCRILISTDNGNTWEQVGKTYTGSGKKWEEVTVDLKSYVGSENPVYVGFWFISDIYKELLGWYIDDVEIFAVDDIAPLKPTGIEAEFKVVGVELKWDDPIDSDVEKYQIYRKSESEDFELIGESNDNLYIDSTVEEETIYEYKIRSVDFASNESEFSEVIKIKTGIVEKIYFSDFELDNGGFTSDGENNSWEWGEPNSGPGEAYTGKKVWATNLDGDYPLESDSWIESPIITLPEEGDSILSFTHWYQTDYYHVCFVAISTDGGEEWNYQLPNNEFSGDGGKWENVEIPLSEYKGKDIKLRFWFLSDWGPTEPGWYIDNILIAKAISTEVVENNVSLKEKIEDMRMGLNSNRVISPSVEVLESVELLEDEKIDGIPVDAVVTILETGVSVGTDPKTGEYRIHHLANIKDETWTLYAEAYGYYPEERIVNLEKDGCIIEDFKLNPIPKGVVTGKVIDKVTKEPVVDAEVIVKNDRNYETVTTNTEGEFTIPDVYEGDYILEIKSDDYHTKEVEVYAKGNDEVFTEVSMKKYVGHPEELVYDDGTAEDGMVMYPANSGLLLRMTPKQYGKVIGTRIFFDKDFPVPGGDYIGIVLMDSDEDGLPGKQIGETKFVDIDRGEWNYIDLKDFGFSTDKDFYIGTYQDKPGELMPAIGIDENSRRLKRGYYYINNGLWSMDDDGNLMIRGVMSYSLDEPKITNMPEVYYTKENVVLIEGIINQESGINVYLNNNVVDTTIAKDNEFAVEVQLQDGENRVYVTGAAGDQETEPSNIITIIKDQQKPKLEVLNPSQVETIVNEEIIHIIGNATDEYFDKLIINEVEVKVAENGDFHHRIMLDEGENTIIIKALDLAGNETVVERNVSVKLDDPVLTDIKPDEDLIIEPGDEVEVSFKGETGGTASFRVVQPLNISNYTEEDLMEMVEEEPGFYKGSFIMPEDIVLKNAYIEIEFIDIAGNRTTAIALGSITVGENLEPSEDQPMEDLPSNTVIVGDEAFDIRYLNNNEDAQLKLIEWYSRGEEIYIKLSHNLIVNIRGEEVGIEELPDELIYYNSDGESTVYKR